MSQVRRLRQKTTAPQNAGEVPSMVLLHFLPLGTRKENEMKRYLCVFLLSLLPFSALTEPMPALPADSIMMGYQECKHIQTGAVGTCYVFVQPSGDYWVVFVQDGQPQILTYIEGGTIAHEVWTSDKFGTF